MVIAMGYHKKALFVFVITLVNCMPLDSKTLYRYSEWESQQIDSYNKWQHITSKYLSKDAKSPSLQTSHVVESSDGKDRSHGARDIESMSLKELMLEAKQIIENLPDEVILTSRRKGSEVWQTGYLNKHNSAVLKSIADKIKSFIYNLTCDSCKIFVMFIQELLAEKKSKDDIRDEVTKACIALHVEDDRICKAVTKEFEEEVLTVFDKLALNQHEVCGLLVGDACDTAYDPDRKWNITLPHFPKPPVTPPIPPKALK